MGRIFSWQEIESEQIPELENFELVGNMLRSELSACPAVIGALICGSFLCGDHNRRSDVDCIVLYRLENRKEAIKVIQKLGILSSKQHIPLELIPIDSKLAPISHHLASTFVEHLIISSKEAGSIIKANPVPFLRFDPLSFIPDTKDYLRHKIERFDRGEGELLTMSTKQRYRLLQKAVEFPVYAARKVLRCLGREFTRGDSKKEILRIYLKLKGFSVAKKILLESLEIDGRYTRQVEKQLLERNKEEYRRMLGELRRFIPKALQFARINLLAVDRF